MRSYDEELAISESAIQQLMVQYGDSIFRMCYVYLHDIGFAEEATQDTFMKAHQAMAGFRGESAEKTWLMRIAINTCKDYQRSSWLKLFDRSVSTDKLQENSYEPVVQDDTVIIAIKKLPSIYKEVILLRYYQNFSLAEIADVLGIPTPTASSRLRLAKNKLRKKLEGWYFDEE